MYTWSERYHPDVMIIKFSIIIIIILSGHWHTYTDQHMGMQQTSCMTQLRMCCINIVPIIICNHPFFFPRSHTNMKTPCRALVFHCLLQEGGENPREVSFQPKQKHGSLLSAVQALSNACHQLSDPPSGQQQIFQDYSSEAITCLLIRERVKNRRAKKRREQQEDAFCIEPLATEDELFCIEPFATED